MKFRGSLGLLATAAVLAACGSSTQPDDGGDVTGTDAIIMTDRVTPPPDRVVPPDSDPGEDVVTPGDDATPGDDVVTSDDVVTPGDDVVTSDDVVVPPMDGAVGMDVVVPPMDAAPDVVVPPPDVVDDGPPAPMCPSSGLNESCPAMGSMGICAPLTAGTRTLDLSGMTAGIAASCEGMSTGAGPDGAIPLVITANSNVAIRVEALGTGAVTAALYAPNGCGLPGSQRGCVNTNRGAAQTLNATNLAPGTYWVSFSREPDMAGTVPARINVTTTITAAPPRMAGDVCPGVTVPINGGDTAINASMFGRTGNEIPTTGCANIMPNLDFVFSYTIATTSDVTIDVLAPGGSVARMNHTLQTSCGDTMSTSGTCSSVNTNSYRRTVNRQAPGTYYVITQAAVSTMTPPTFLANVRTVPSAAAGPADMCPGIPLSAGVTASAGVTTLAQDQAFGCFPESTADGNFSFNAPAGQDVLVEANSTARTALELQSPCRMNAMSCTATGVAGRSWRRYSGLTAGQSYSVHAGSNAGAGNLDVVFRNIPPLTPVAITGNEACASARLIPTAGGVFTGNTAMMAANTTAPFNGAGSCMGCNTFTGRDAVYRLDLTARTRVLATLRSGTTGYDPVMYVRTGMTCQDNLGGGGGGGSSLLCADDYYGQDGAFDRTLDAGTYWIFVDTCVAGGGGGGAPTGGAYNLEVITLAP
ncbi:MAG: hypothetical protein Q8Q09_20165 [Deltaproteobacteria bacterium]|nr:hypothetical protein [Deltaproteobacteria bacterium]